MKKFISIGLCLSLIVSTSAYAKPQINTELVATKAIETNVENILAETEENFSSELDTVIDEVADLESYNILSECLIDVKENENDSLTYVYQIKDDIKSEITPITTDEGDGYIFKEGDITNEVIIAGNGDIYLDGNLVTVNEYTTNAEVQESENFYLDRTFATAEENITNAELDENGNFYLDGNLVAVEEISFDEENNSIPILKSSPTITTYTYRCPYGEQDDYYVLDSQEFNAEVAFGKAISAISVTAFIFIMTGGLAAFIGFSASLMSNLYDYICSSDPRSSAASFKDWVYTHYNGYMVSSTRGVKLHSIYVWPLKNYQLRASHIYSYEIRDYER